MNARACRLVTVGALVVAAGLSASGRHQEPSRLTPSREQLAVGAVESPLYVTVSYFTMTLRTRSRELRRTQRNAVEGAR